jgi:hypothetical protein
MKMVLINVDLRVALSEIESSIPARIGKYMKFAKVYQFCKSFKRKFTY